MGNTIKSRILLVEDEPALRTGTEQFLRQRGFTVVTATSGEEALEKFAGADVIILDIMLPGMSGIEVLHQIRQISDVPVLMLTALHDEPTQVASFDELADDYMSKPFSLVILEKRIKALLRRQQPVILWPIRDFMMILMRTSSPRRCSSSNCSSIIQTWSGVGRPSLTSCGVMTRCRSTG